MFPVGPLIYAGMGAVCCVGPAVVLAWGIGGLHAIFSAWKRYFPVALGLTMAAFGVAFYRAYRKQKVLCEDGSCRLVTVNPEAKDMLWTVFILTLAAMSAPYVLASLARRILAAN